jgi:hypothetical protein
MRSFAPIALFATFLLAAGLDAQSLTEHAAAAAGATIGTAAGKPLSNAIGSIFGKLDKDTSQAAGAKTVKKIDKPAEPAPAKASVPAVTLPAASSNAPIGDSEAVSAPSRTRRQAHVAIDREVPAPFIQSATYQPPVVKEPSVEDVANIKVGATGQELQAALGVPESHITIPDDDGRLLETCQYWAKGQPIGRVRLVNGQVVSVETSHVN